MLASADRCPQWRISHESCHRAQARPSHREPARWLPRPDFGNNPARGLSIWRRPLVV